MSIRAPLLGALSLPWFVHATVVLASWVGLRPLASQTASSALLVAGCVFSVLTAVACRGAAAAATPHPTGVSTTVLLALRALIGVGALVFALGILAAATFPIVAYDALAYRMPVIAQWLDAGSIAWVRTDDPVRNGYPLGQEAVSAVVAASTGSLRFADATSFFYVAGGALSIVWLAESWKVRSLFAWTSASVFVLAPMMVLNAGSGYVDAAFAGATVALICCTTLATRDAEPDPIAVGAAGMAAAHVLALKGTGAGFVVLCAAGALLRLGLRLARRVPAPSVERSPRSPRLRKRAALGLVVALALPGTFWSVRDLTYTGNPVWPVDVRLAGNTLWAGVGTMEQIIDVLHNTPADFARLTAPVRVLHTWLQLRGTANVYDDRRAGLGWTWPLLALPAIVCVLKRALRRAKRGPLDEQMEMVFVLALTAAFFALQPMNWWPRYTLWLWGAGALALALEAERLCRRGRVRMLTCGALALTAVCCVEGACALATANGTKVALWRLSRPGADLHTLLDTRSGVNAVYWVPPEFWELGLDLRSDLCRGAWKPETDDAILDGVFAQLTPRPRMHILDDDSIGWPNLRQQARAAGCSELLLFKGSPALAWAAGDPNVVVEHVLGFDPLSVVRTRDWKREMEACLQRPLSAGIAR
jgi:hypothetical protein